MRKLGFSYGMIVALALTGCGDDSTTSTATDSAGGTTTGGGTTEVGTTTGTPTTDTPTTGVTEGSASATEGTTGGSTGPGTTTGATTDATTGGSSTGAPAVCGDGVVDAGEECDDGNMDDTDTCLPTCVNAICGDGFVIAGVEACDDGNMVDDDACSNACAMASCGDGAVQMGEACDDGNMDDTDDCLSTCMAASCGDTFVQMGVEECDDGNMDDTDACTMCKNAKCGDMVVQMGVEECDDGNMVDTDMCLATCKTAKCGDGKVQMGVEECDDANMVDTDACLGTCKNAKCGDGKVQMGVEDCDDGNANNGDGCSAMCKNEGCVFDISKLPATIHPNNFYGEIAFDANCDLLVVDAFNDGLHRVNKTTGAVTVVFDNFGTPSTNGVVYRKSDDTIYVSTDSPSRLYAVKNNMSTLVVNYPTTVNAIAVAPMGFGNYGDQIIGVTTAGTVLAVNTGTKAISTVGTGSGIMSDLVFAPDGKLYVANQANNRIDIVTSGGVFTQLIGGLSQPDGLGVDTDGSRLFVAHFPNGGGRIDRVSLPGAVLTAGNAMMLDGGYYTSGVVVDALDNVLVKSSLNSNAIITGFKSP